VWGWGSWQASPSDSEKAPGARAARRSVWLTGAQAACRGVAANSRRDAAAARSADSDPGSVARHRPDSLDSPQRKNSEYWASCGVQRARGQRAGGLDALEPTP
jgi:hypothetical protein